MRKYKITVGGRGAECYVHSINTENRKLLFEGKVEYDEMESEQISEILNVESITDTDNVFVGPYNDPEHFMITVTDENEKKIWESSDKHEFKEIQEEYIFDDNDALVVEDYIKGEFYSYEVELEKDFDPTKLLPIITEIGNSVVIISDLIYNEVELKPYKNYGDYWSKGITYYLN
jgi:hypothetical protein